MAKLRSGFVMSALCVSLLSAGIAAAQMTPQTSLNNCQKAAKLEGARFVKRKLLALSICLQAISTQLIKNNAADPSAAARTCVTQFRKINDSRLLGKSFKEKLATGLLTKCDPASNIMLTHSLDDVTGKGAPTVPQHIDTKQIDQWCTNFGGDGSIDTVQEWADCIAAAHECEVEQAIAEQYPRAPEWINAVKPFMAAVPTPSTDTARTTDAVTGATTVHDTIDADGDNKPDINCAQPPKLVCSTACCYEEFALGSQVSCFQYTGTASEISTFTTNCTGKASTPPGAWSMAAAAGVCGNPPDFPTHVNCSSGGTPGSFVLIPKDSSCQ